MIEEIERNNESIEDSAFSGVEFNDKKRVSKTPLIMLLIIAIFVLMLAIVFVSSSGNKKDFITVPDLTGKPVKTAVTVFTSNSNNDSSQLVFLDTINKKSVSYSDMEHSVCHQDISPNTEVKKGTVITLIVAKDCDNIDSYTGERVDPTVPNLVGENLKVAQENLKKLQTNLNIEISDATQLDRVAINHDNWIVCSQDKSPGEVLNIESDVISLTYARNTQECDEKFSQEGNIFSGEITKAGLTESTAKDTCERNLLINNPDLTAQWVLGSPKISIIEDNGNEKIRVAVNVRKKLDVMGTMVCDITGTNDNPEILHFEIIP